MINICEEFAKCHSIVFNPSKTNPINPISKRKLHLVIAYIIFVLEITIYTSKENVKWHGLLSRSTGTITVHHNAYFKTFNYTLRLVYDNGDN